MRVFGLFVAILVLVAIVVLPVHVAVGQEGPNPIRDLPAIVERGETFDVIINFTCPADDFNGISLRDTAPDGWDVTVDGAWCDPYAQVKAVGNQAQFGWIGPYFPPKNFTAKYKVTVPCNASSGNYSFSVSSLRWKTGGLDTINTTVITGDHVLEATGPTISFAPTSIAFYGAVNGTNPQNQTLELGGSTQCILNWTANITGANVTWLSMSPESGNCTDEYSSVAVVSVNMSGMSSGNHTANITIEAPEAKNPMEIIPVVLYIRETGTLEVKVDFPARGSYGPRWIEPFVVKLFPPGDYGQVIWTGVATTNNTGVFTIPDVVVATYDIGIKNCTCLSKLVTNVTLIADNTTVADFGTLREGDIVEDDIINIGDLAALGGAFGSSEGGPGWNVNADFDRDGNVNIGDLAALGGNFGMQGDLLI